jgi:ubiquinone/menaquinone biosynthesis C-methylase UbiE
MDDHERMKAYYDRRAPEYDRSILGLGEAAPPKDIAEDRAALLQAISRLPPGRVLDVGCGTGYLTQHLGGEVVGLDQSAAMLDIARERVPWADFVRGDALNMQFADGSFDLVFASNFYGLLREAERKRFLDEARRIAGEIVLVEPTKLFSQGARSEGWEERVPSDGSRYTIYRRYFTAEGLAEELGGRVLLAGKWVVMAAAHH